MASVKIAPHIVDAGIIDAAARLAGFGSQPVVWVSKLLKRRVGVVVKESIRGVARTRFEESVRAKVEGLGSQILEVVYVEDDADAVETAIAQFTRGSETADVVLTAGSASTDPRDTFFTAIDALGGRVVRRGVPAHPGSMLWLARVGGTSILGLPTCGAYSKATAVDLLLPAPAGRRAGLGADRRQDGPRRDPDPVTAVPVPAVRAGAGRAGRLRPSRGGTMGSQDDRDGCGGCARVPVRPPGRGSLPGLRRDRRGRGRPAGAGGRARRRLGHDRHGVRGRRRRQRTLAGMAVPCGLCILRGDADHARVLRSRVSSSPAWRSRSTASPTIAGSSASTSPCRPDP